MFHQVKENQIMCIKKSTLNLYLTCIFSYLLLAINVSAQALVKSPKDGHITLPIICNETDSKGFQQHQAHLTAINLLIPDFLP